MTDWRGIAAADFAFPEGGSLDTLLPELVEMLASPDPETRDEIAFGGLATWVDEGVVPDDRLRPLGDTMAERFGADEVWTRSFAALVLDVIVSSRRVCEPAWVDAFEAWYAGEQDVRGYVAEHGWLHAVAHGADLLGDLGRHPDVDPVRMLDLAAARMLAEAAMPWHDQEDDRLAHAVAKVLTRVDLPAAAALGWLDRVEKGLADRVPEPVPAYVSNTLHTLRALHMIVDRGVRLAPEQVVVAPYRAQVLDRIAEVLHTVTPWMW